MGMGYANPRSLITARLLSRRKTPIDHTFLDHRIGSAVEFRKRVLSGQNAYRLFFSESDLLPGLIVDRYGDCLVVQSLTAGMDSLQEQVVEVLADLMAPQGIYARNDSRMRELEGIPLEKRPLHGSVPETVTIDSMGLRFLVDIQEGQKTGFFLDQEANRDLMKKYVFPEAKVLDLFSYTGGWGVHAAAAGAAHVTAVDSSRGALDLAETNASLNNLGSNFTTIREPVVDFLKKNKESWDLIIADPPSFIRSRSKIKEGHKGYIDLNRRALGKLGTGGILVTCSCSHHLSREDFEEILSIASQQSGRRTRVLEVRGQGPDHPILLSMPETRYLKVMVVQVI
jgi:23S rRNA (cytosine1962-C5)-methyltransferase